MRASLERWLHRQWSWKSPLALLLSPLSLVFLYASRRKRQETTVRRMPLPVIVVGNIYVGGTGKTPVTIALAEALAEKGFHPGIISRGYMGSRTDAMLVDPKESKAGEVGDEPLLIARTCAEKGIPVAVGAARPLAAWTLIHNCPQVDVIISDDGMQHYSLARDIEIAVVGARGLGNGWVLPAGPLREPPSRLNQVDAIVLNATTDTFDSRTPRYAATSDLGSAVSIATGEKCSIDEFAQQCEGKKVLASAGIANPERFFAMLRGHGIACTELPLPDHFDFAENPFPADAEVILVTSKDGVKCSQHPQLASDARIHVVTLDLTIDPYLVDVVSERLHALASQPRPGDPVPKTLQEARKLYLGK